MNYIKYIIIALFVLPAQLIAQENDLAEAIDKVLAFSEKNDSKLSAISIFAKLPDEEKLIYLDKKWQNGVILTNEGETIFFTGRFEVFNQTIEVNLNGQTRVLSVAYTKLVKLGSKTFIPIMRGQIEEAKKNAYMELLFKGKANLLAFYEPDTKTITQGISAAAPGELILTFREKFFISKDLQEFEQLPSKKKLINGMFSSQATAITAYLKENKYKRNKADLVQLFYFYNELQGGS